MSSRTVKTMNKRLGKVQQELERTRQELARSQDRLRQAQHRAATEADLDRRFESLMVRVEKEPAARYGETWALRMMIRPEAFISSSYSRGGFVNTRAEIEEMAFMVARDAEREIRKVFRKKLGVEATP